jgi:pilus assembly protein CpaC
MRLPSSFTIIVSTSILLGLCSGGSAAGQTPAPSDAAQLTVGVGKSLIFDSAARIQRVSIGSPTVAEAVMASPSELLVHGKAAGETSLIIWQEGGKRRVFELHVVSEDTKLENVQRQLREELDGQQIELHVVDGAAFLRGKARDTISAQRAVAIASTIAKPVNLLQVEVPAPEPQILLRVRFANVDRAVSRELGVNLVSTGATNTIGAVTTGQFTPPRYDGDQGTFTFSDALNLFLFRPDLNLGATIRALQVRRLLQILAEPNLMAMNGRKASFLAGGEFPFPVLQGGANANAVTIQFREFGIRLDFVPTITPRGTIRLAVQPEVSSLDFANALSIQGFNIPALSSRKVDTEIELESGQTFAIAGLLDNRVAETFSRVPGISSIPVLGKLFQSRALLKNESELLVLVTPELVQPLQAGDPKPTVPMDEPFLRGLNPPAQNMGVSSAPAPTLPPARHTVPYEVLVPEKEGSNPGTTSSSLAAPTPVGSSPAPPQAPGGTPQASAAATGGSGNPGSDR